MCTYQTNLQHGSLGYVTAGVKLVRAVCFQLSLVTHIEKARRRAFFIKIVHNRRDDGVDCFNPYAGASTGDVSGHWVSPKPQPWSYFWRDVPRIVWNLCTGDSTKSFLPALCWGIGRESWSQCAPLKIRDLEQPSERFSFSEIRPLHASAVLKYCQN